MKRTEVKICGITNYVDALGAVNAGADYLGFILYAGSWRGITAVKAVEIIERLGNAVKTVGVFVNAPRSEVEVVAEDCGFHAVQLHGDENLTDFKGLRVPVWRVVRWKGATWQPDPDEWAVERYLVDATVDDEYGGTGICADWNRAAQLAAARPVMLAGGLTHENVGAAIATVRPLGVDVVTGVESEPGRKDHAKLKSFIEAVRNA